MDDICQVDPRTNTVTIEQAPTTGERYEPFTLQPTYLWYPSYAARRVRDSVIRRK